MQANPPSNAGYMIAAYVTTAVILVVYALGLWIRARKALQDSEP